VRHDFLKRILNIQQHIRNNGPQEVHNLELITFEELNEIRRIWIQEKHEIEDSLPAIYEEITGIPYPDYVYDQNSAFGAAELNILKELCGADDLHYELIRNLLAVEKSYGGMERRAGLFQSLEKAFTRNFYESVEDAVSRASRKRFAESLAAEGRYEQQAIIFSNSEES
jgi:DNA sulfur modification protein DndC